MTAPRHDDPSADDDGDELLLLLPPRPIDAKGTFLRILSLCDSYTMEHYPRVRTAALAAKRMAEADEDGCVILTVHSGDFLSPSPLTSLDFGKAMMEGLNRIPVDFVCFGNHEFDLPAPVLQKRITEFQGTWLNANIRDPEFVGRDGEVLPGHALVPVGERKVAIGGFCTGQQDIYRPGTLSDVTPVTQSVLDVWRKAASEGADALVPLTHQLMHEDRELAAALHKQPGTHGRVPIILGGHDHEAFEEVAKGGVKILKVGQDAVTIGVVDLWWTEAGDLRSSHALVPSAEFAPDPDLAAMVAEKESLLDHMREVKICDLPEPISSKAVRKQTQGVATLLCRKIKRSLKHVDICLLQGGCVRGRSDYGAGPFTYGDLMEEMPFETEIATVTLPGWVIEESVWRSRASAPEEEQPTFLHHDEDTAFEAVEGGRELVCKSINGAPFDRDRDYRVAIYHVLAVGMNEVQPLLSFIRDSGMRVPARDDTIPGKQLVLEQCMREHWRSLLPRPPQQQPPRAQKQQHRQKHNQQQQQEVVVAVKEEEEEEHHTQKQQKQEEVMGRGESGIGSMFCSMDANHDGQVSKEELAEFLRANGHGGEAASEQLLTWLLDAADADHDGLVSLPDLRRTMLGE